MLKTQKLSIQTRHGQVVLNFGNLNFDIASNFSFRHSILYFNSLHKNVAKKNVSQVSSTKNTKSKKLYIIILRASLS